jgi:hypothetical protein
LSFPFLPRSTVIIIIIIVYNYTTTILPPQGNGNGSGVSDKLSQNEIAALEALSLEFKTLVKHVSKYLKAQKT